MNRSSSVRKRRRPGFFKPVPNFPTCGARYARSTSRCGLSANSRMRSSPGDTAYIWLSGGCGGILGMAEVLEAPRIQPEPPAQIRFIRKTEKFAGDQVRAKLRLLKRLKPLIPRTYLQSRAELCKLSILHCPRGTNFRVNRQEAEILKSLVASHMPAPLVRNVTESEKRVVFAEE